MMPIIIYIPLDTSYLAEFINDFLKVYNTVGIQVTKDCYVMRLEQTLSVKKPRGSKNQERKGEIIWHRWS